VFLPSVLVIGPVSGLALRPRPAVLAVIEPESAVAGERRAPDRMVASVDVLFRALHPREGMGSGLAR
jgi:hypothetical protein